MKEELFKILQLNNPLEIKNYAKRIGVQTQELKYYNDYCIYPNKALMKKILKESPELSEIEIKIRLGQIDSDLLEILKENIGNINSSKAQKEKSFEIKKIQKPAFRTENGLLYNDDCLEVMRNMPDDSVDLIFADPPFNLNKFYESGMNDKLSKTDYLNWTESWLSECVRILKNGGAFFVWNLPSWNTYSSAILNNHLNLRHWIAVDIKYSLPIANKLYPSHYALLYYIKGSKPNTFHQERLPIEVCPHCAADIKDYGGYKNKLNKKGISLTDVWKDISPVRHKKYKNRESNELPLNLLERIISLTTNEGDLVFDPFGGSGTTYVVSEILNRRWIGSEIGPLENIINRFENLSFAEELIKEVQKSKNVLFTDITKKKRCKNGHWLF